MRKIDAYKRVALATVLLGVNSLVFADEILIAQDDQQTNFQDNRSTGSPSNGKQRMGAPSLGDKRPPYNNPNRFMFDASFIYWQAIADGLDYGIDQQFISTFTGQQTSFGLTSTDRMKDKQLHFKWDPGFKVGLGVVFGEHDEWDLFTNWTWLHSTANVSAGTGNPVNLTNLASGSGTGTLGVETDFQVGSWSPSLLGTPVTQSRTKWRLQYNTVDLELGRNFFLGKGLTFRPHMGLRGAFIHQKTKVNYNIASTGYFVMPVILSQTPQRGSSFGSSEFKGNNNFNGVGLRGGFDMKWNFVKEFAVYSSLATSILWGKFHVKEIFDLTATITQLGGIPQVFDSDASFRTRFDRIRTNLQASMGIMWHRSFNKDKQHLALRVGYEFNEWFQQNELRDIQNALLQFNGTRTPGDLGLQGVTFDLQFDL